MSFSVSGPVPDASWEGVAAAAGAGGEPEVDAAAVAVVVVWEGFCRRERSAERTGRVSIESGVRPSERGSWREGG